MAGNAKNTERLKLALIPVLGLVLLFVVMGGEEESASSSTSSSVNRKSAPDAVTDPSKPKATADIRNAVWPHQSLKAIIAHNPLELNDPRVEVAKAFSDAGINGVFLGEPMTVLEFFPELDPALKETARFAGVRYLFEWSETLRQLESAIEAEQVAESVAAIPSESSVTEGVDPQSTEGESSQSIDIAILRQRLRTLQGQPVRMFLKTRRGNSVLLGPRRVTEGEIIDEGIRVSSITRKGVKLEIVEEPSLDAVPQASVPTDDREKL